MYVENVKSQMRKGMLEYCVMLLLDKKSYYSSDIIDELERANLIVVEGTLYPLLSRLKKEALLDYEWQESPSGPPRKYYKLTDAGSQSLSPTMGSLFLLKCAVALLIAAAFLLLYVGIRFRKIGGITAALCFGYLAALLFRSRPKR